MVVAALDRDFDYEAEDLAANAWTNPGGVNGCPAGTHGYHVPSGACEPDAIAVHGTRMGWIIGAVGDNGQGMSGVNWTTSLMGVTHRNEKTHGSVVESIDWVIGARKPGCTWGDQRFLGLAVEQARRSVMRSPVPASTASCWSPQRATTGTTGTSIRRIRATSTCRT